MRLLEGTLILNIGTGRRRLTLNFTLSFVLLFSMLPMEFFALLAAKTPHNKEDAAAAAAV